MKNIYVFLIVLLLYSCNKKEEVTPIPTDIKVASINLKISKPSGTYWSGESDALVLSADVTDKNGKTYTNFTGKINYFANDVAMANNTYPFTKEENVVFKAKIEEVVSNVTANYLVKDPAKELSKIEVINGFFNKYAVNHLLTGRNPEISVKGFASNNQEIPISKGMKATNGTESINLASFTFTKTGAQKISINAYGKSAELIFNVRDKNRKFDLVRIPLMFHFCPPGPYQNATNKITDAQYFTRALSQLAKGEVINQLNQMYRNKFTPAAGNDPNAADTFIEFYLAEKDPNGQILTEKGVNRLNFTKPYVPFEQKYDQNTEAALNYEKLLKDELSRWNRNEYINIVVEPFGGWGYTGIGKAPKLDINRKNVMPQEYFNLPITSLDESLFANNTTSFYYEHIRLNGSKNVLTSSEGFLDTNLYLNVVLPHELGHIFGLNHTFWRTNENNCGENVHSDGIFDTPIHSVTQFDKTCNGNSLLQHNLMNYIVASTTGSFTYDQATVMRSRIEAQFSVPTPRNKGKAQN